MKWKQMRVINGILLYLCMIISTSTPSSGQVTISLIHKNNGLDDYFIAKKAGKTLWTYASWGPILYEARSGTYVLESSQLIVVDRYGTVRERLDISEAHDPRSIFLKNGCLVYDGAALAIAVYDPKTEGTHLAEWLRGMRFVCVYNVRTFHKLWQAPESDVGLPISCSNRYLDTMRIVNLKRCLENSKVTPVVAINKVDVRGGYRLRSAILSISRSDAFDLMSAFLDFECVTPAHVKWNKNGVHADGLFEKNYHGA